MKDGVIRASAHNLPGAREEIDARGPDHLPGLIDVHLHFNEPGRTEWEGAATGSRALAAGGGTLFFDMPLNSTPCTVDRRGLRGQTRALSNNARSPTSACGAASSRAIATELEELAERGVVGFKAFLCNSGLPEFPRADDLTLYEGMQVAAARGLPVAVHAESEEITAGLTRRIRAAGAQRRARSFWHRAPCSPKSRPSSAPRCWPAKPAPGCTSSTSAPAAAWRRRSKRAPRGTNLTIETCPHYLFFTEDDMERIGAVAKCAPPLRPAADRDALWQHVLAGDIDMIASDHSPSSPDLKCDADFFRIWGGIAGVQSTLAVLLEAGHHAARTLAARPSSDIAAETPARRFRIAGKGSNRAGLRCRSHPGGSRRILHARARRSCTSGTRSVALHRLAAFAARVRRTLLRGQTIFRDGRITAAANGRFVRPHHPGVRMHHLGQTRSASHRNHAALHSRYVCPRAAARHASAPPPSCTPRPRWGRPSRSTPPSSNPAAVWAPPRPSAFVYVLEGETRRHAGKEATRSVRRRLRLSARWQRSRRRRRRRAAPR